MASFISNYRDMVPLDFIPNGQTSAIDFPPVVCTFCINCGHHPQLTQIETGQITQLLRYSCYFYVLSEAILAEIARRGMTARMGSRTLEPIYFFP